MERSQPFVSSWDNVVSEGRNELVFEDKNKEYGAYVIRKKYNFSLLIGILISVFILVMAVLIPLINTLWDSIEIAPKEEYKVVELTLDALPKPKVLPMAKPIEQPPVLAKIKFTVPEPTEEEVKEPPVAQTQLDDKKIGDQTQKGDEDASDLNVETSNDIIGNEVVEAYPVNVDKPALPAGGWDAFGNFIIDNFNKNLITADEINNGIDVYIKIGATGDLVDVTINRSCGNKALDNEALRVIKMYKKRWTPAMYNGKPWGSARIVPLVFPEEE